MSQTPLPAYMKTIRCCLCVNPETRCYFWETMVTYTLLVNELLEQVPQHPKFPTWQQLGKVSRFEVRDILKPLKEKPAYADLPKRFLTSAELMVTYVYKSWLALQKRRHRQLVGKLRWLQAIENDLQAMATSDLTLEAVQNQAHQILQAAEQELGIQQNQKTARAKKRPKKGNSLLGYLLNAHEASNEDLERRAICHLLRHNLTVSEEEETPDEIQFRIERKRIEVERLKEQLQSQLPKGRDPTDERYLEKLGAAIALPDIGLSLDDAEDWSAWKGQKQLPLYNRLPYPILYGSADDLVWSILSDSAQTNQKAKKRKKSKRPIERLKVRFKGLDEHLFQVQCDRRQLPFFRQFATDYLTHRSATDDEKFGMGLFALRSACLIWKEDPQAKVKKKKHKRKAAAQSADSALSDAPWETHRLYLHCTFETRLVSREGTEQVRLEKLTRAQKALEPPEDADKDKAPEQVEAPTTLTKNQESRLKSKKTTLERLQRTPPDRPSLAPYQGNPDIVLGISLSRHEPVTAVILDKAKGQVLECQTSKALLKIRNAKGSRRNQSVLKRQKEQSRLINRWRSLRRHNLEQRPEDQHHDNYRQQDSESGLGEYIDRLIAARIIQMAQKWGTGTIVLPTLAHIRESVESDIQASAERRHPHNKELQALYAKQYRAEFHRWSYGRLLQYIKECAIQQGLAVRKGEQPKQGTEQQKALEVIQSAYQ
jgi:hypothetical protein